MTMTKHSEQLPRSAAELEELAEYYGSHDTIGEMEHGEWVEPQPMATTSLRLPADVIDQLKRQARARHVRYTSYVRSILERTARGDALPEIADITERLERIERGDARLGRRRPENSLNKPNAVSRQPGSGGHSPTNRPDQDLSSGCNQTRSAVRVLTR